ncbi:MAG: nucleotide pyrophosphohydrolase [Solobacterium sp.]|nr:nucleotide pyrophosphohydrolase [Solobacterium sp.]
MKQETINEILAFTQDRDWEQFHTPTNLAKSIVIEAAELLECFQWSDEYSLEHVKEELADVFVYCIDLAQNLNLDIDEIIMEKMQKNKEKYPIDKAKGKSTKYTKL